VLRDVPEAEGAISWAHNDPARNHLSFAHPIQITLTQGHTGGSLLPGDFFEHGSHTSGRSVSG
jgi:hypothetical protein